MKKTYEYECWYFKQRAKSCIQCSFVGSTTDLNEWASAPVKTSGNLRNFQRPEVDGHAEDISNFFNQFDENSSPSGIVVGFRMPVECVGEDGSCERRLKSAARGGRKVQRWGWVESTPG
jgi:hypothetical protein